MRWSPRGRQRYLYRSERRGNRVHKRYLGRHEPAQLAARLAALRQSEQEAAEAQWQRQLAALEQLDAALDVLVQQARLWGEAVLLANAYHRPQRHGWRRWRRAQRLLKRQRSQRRRQRATGRTGRRAAR